MKRVLLLLSLLLSAVVLPASGAPQLGDNLWFYWDLRIDAATNWLDGATQTLARARSAGYRGVMLGSGSRVALLPLLDEGKRVRVRAFRRACEQIGLDVAVAVWSFGYGVESFLSYDRNLAAANPVFGTRYRVTDGVAVPLPGERRELLPAGGGVVHSPAREGDIARQSVRLKRDHSYRIHVRGIAEGVEGEWPVRLAVRRTSAPDDAIESRVFRFRPGVPFEDFLQFASMDAEEVIIECSGYNRSYPSFAQITALTLEETPPYHVIRRAGTPVRVRSADGSRQYREGVDFAEIPKAEGLWPMKGTKPLTLTALPGGAIREGDELVVDCFASFPTHGKWTSVCMAGPEVFEIMERSAAAIASDLRPSLWILSFDEVRAGGGCENCRRIGGMDRIYARCAEKAMEIVRRNCPKADVYVWNDMVDPECQKGGGWSQGLYSPISGVWDLLPPGLGIACWTSNRESALRFATARGRKTFVAGYYGRATMDADRDWVRLSNTIPGCDCRGMMYTQWGQGFSRIEEFAAVVREEEGKWGGSAF